MGHLQVLIREILLLLLDPEPEVRELRRSEVLRRAALDLKRQSGSFGKMSGLGADFAGWNGEGLCLKQIDRGKRLRTGFSLPDKTRSVLLRSR